MSSAFEDKSLGLKLKGYAIVPNDFLETKIGIYTPEIVESILTEHPEIVDRWLERLHAEYISKKKQCDFENDPVACFNLSAYEQFEKNYRSWSDGGLIAITLPRERVIRVSKNPLISVTEGTQQYICTKCMAAFATAAELESHRKQEEQEIKVAAKKPKSYEATPNPIWWLAP
jgi:hypothetical protein